MTERDSQLIKIAETIERVTAEGKLKWTKKKSSTDYWTTMFNNWRVDLTTKGSLTVSRPTEDVQINLNPTTEEHVDSLLRILQSQDKAEPDICERILKDFEV